MHVAQGIDAKAVGGTSSSKVAGGGGPGTGGGGGSAAAAGPPRPPATTVTGDSADVITATCEAALATQRGLKRKLSQLTGAGALALVRACAILSEPLSLSLTDRAVVARCNLACHYEPGLLHSMREISSAAAELSKVHDTAAAGATSSGLFRGGASAPATAPSPT